MKSGWRGPQPPQSLLPDFIVGFPGETEEDFEDTLRVVDEIEFAQAFSFKYSQRPGTPSVNHKFHVPEHVKKERLALLQERLNRHQLKFNQNCVKKTISVLLERKGRYEGQLIGRTPFMQPVHVYAPSKLLGQIVELKITAAGQNSLEGEIPRFPKILTVKDKRATKKEARECL